MIPFTVLNEYVNVAEATTTFDENSSSGLKINELVVEARRMKINGASPSCDVNSLNLNAVFDYSDGQWQDSPMTLKSTSSLKNQTSPNFTSERPS
jgi:hypothetical protein